MDSKKEKSSNALTNFLVFSCASILIAFAIAIYIYRYKFGGSLSGQSSDWSNFGSYVGGVFGPLVSFVTLLAVLKTVFLQRELLDAQGVEFERMHQLQRDTFDSQQIQINNTMQQANADAIERARLAILQLIDRWIQMVEKKLDRSTAGLNHIGNWVVAGSDHVKPEQAQKLFDNNVELRATILALLGLYETISLADYFSIKDMRDYYEKEISKIFLAQDEASGE
ncbi:hypothetical protein [Pseudomonas sp. S2_B07]